MLVYIYCRERGETLCRIEVPHCMDDTTRQKTWYENGVKERKFGEARCLVRRDLGLTVLKASFKRQCHEKVR